MTFLQSYKLTNGLRQYTQDYLGTYITLVAGEAGKDLALMSSVGIGTDYEKSGRKHPYVLIAPSDLKPDYDEYQGMVESAFTADCLIAVDGFSSAAVLEHSLLYADAYMSMISSDDTLKGLCDHAEVSSIGYFPGGTGNRMFTVISIVLITQTAA